jgi:hypothetical protein
MRDDNIQNIASREAQQIPLAREHLRGIRFIFKLNKMGES